MAFLFARENNCGETWYVGGKFVHKKIGRSKALAERSRGDIEARIERGEAGLLNNRFVEELAAQQL